MGGFKFVAVCVCLLGWVGYGCEPGDEVSDTPSQPHLEVGSESQFGDNGGVFDGNENAGSLPEQTEGGSGGAVEVPAGTESNTDDVPKDRTEPVDNSGQSDNTESGGTDDPTDPANPGDTTDPVDSGQGAIGDGCTASTDCKGDGAACLDLPGGYCSISDCAGANACPEGSLCYSFGDAGDYCLQVCDSTSECRPDEGYICDEDSTCWPGTAGDGGGNTGTGNGSGGDGNSPVGGPCETDLDCADPGASCYPPFLNEIPTGFVNGYCLINDCVAGGCPSGSSCETIYANGGTACMASCSSNSECRDDGGYACFQPGICFPGCGQGSTCPTNWGCDAELGQCVPACDDTSCGPDLVCGDDGVCVDPPCSANSCGVGMVCTNGVCVPDLAGGPGAGPGPVCNNLPQKDCVGSASYCGELIKFDQTEAYGYTDYPLNGETWNNQYRSFARRDLVMLVSWATAYVECKAVNWGGGNGYPLGLGDMSEENGAIPGTAVGYPGHPQNTHTNGYDIDIAYYQSTGTDNYLKSVCEHYIGNVDQYHCVESPDILDLWRSALFIGALQSSNRTRVIGVDGQIGSLMEGALDVLCANGWVEPNACNNPKLAFEVEDNGLGWYKFHHHHLHLSLYGYSSSGFVDASGAECLREDCVDMTEAMEEMASIKVPGHIHPSLPPLPQAPLSRVP